MPAIRSSADNCAAVEDLREPSSPDTRITGHAGRQVGLRVFGDTLGRLYSRRAERLPRAWLPRWAVAVSGMGGHLHPSVAGDTVTGAGDSSRCAVVRARDEDR